jgi:hypothetical protein
MGVFFKRRIQLYRVSGGYQGGYTVDRKTAHPDNLPGNGLVNLWNAGSGPALPGVLILKQQAGVYS